MKKILMILVCLMTFVSVNGQNLKIRKDTSYKTPKRQYMEHIRDSIRQHIIDSVSKSILVIPLKIWEKHEKEWQKRFEEWKNPLGNDVLASSNVKPKNEILLYNKVKCYHDRMYLKADYELPNDNSKRYKYFVLKYSEVDNFISFLKKLKKKYEKYDKIAKGNDAQHYTKNIGLKYNIHLAQREYSILFKYTDITTELLVLGGRCIIILHFDNQFEVNFYSASDFDNVIELINGSISDNAEDIARQSMTIKQAEEDRRRIKNLFK